MQAWQGPPLPQRGFGTDESVSQPATARVSYIRAPTLILEAMRKAESMSDEASSAKKGLFCMGPAPGFISVTVFLEMDERDFVEVPVGKPRETVLAVCYTSGSTGLPKGSEITHYTYVAAFYCTT
ncbi:hypothetical protein MTO96_038731 [Rhipicephalus appendiculatus]